MLLGIVVGLLTVIAVASFLLALRRASAAPRIGELPASDGREPQLDRLGIGALVDVDDRTWTVRGMQRIGGGAWTAWHLEDAAQRALLAVERDDPDQVVLSVGAERTVDLDPLAPPLRWRELEWVPVPAAATAPLPAAGEGRRALWRDEEAVPAATTVERVAFANPELPRRRLTFLREPGAPWAAWIGDVLPATALDVVAPRPAGAAARDAG